MTFPYVVQRGDSLFRIARRFGMNTAALESANPQIVNFDYIVPGQVLQIPERPANVYVIQPGDTFFAVSQRFNVTVEALTGANPSVQPRQLQVGQSIVIPVASGGQIVDVDVPYGYEEMTKDIADLQQRYPFLRVGYIGESVQRRKLPVIILGRGPTKIHYNGAFHANEWITALLLMKFIEDFAQAFARNGAIGGADVNQLFNKVSLWIVPMVNPDGVELVLSGISPQDDYYEKLLSWNNGSFNFQNWKANIRGVDLNDQFPANWEEEKERRSPEGPGPRDYPGEAPLTEPEAIAVAELTRNEKFQLIMAFHTQGEVIFWNYRDLEPPESEVIVDRLAAVSGYEPVKIFNSDAGYKDWFILEFGKPGFTIEAGLGVNPLPIQQFPRIYEATSAIMIEGMLAV